MQHNYGLGISALENGACPVYYFALKMISEHSLLQQEQIKQIIHLENDAGLPTAGPIPKTYHQHKGQGVSKFTLAVWVDEMIFFCTLGSLAIAAGWERNEESHSITI